VEEEKRGGKREWHMNKPKELKGGDQCRLLWSCRPCKADCQHPGRHQIYRGVYFKIRLRFNSRGSISWFKEFLAMVSRRPN
jgi:hypothetical protein